jgi:predicted permease
VESRFILFQAVIIIPFVLGSFLRTRIPDAPLVARRLIGFNLIFLEPWVALWSIWGLVLSGDVMFLPLAGLLLVLAGFGLGYLSLPALSLGEKGRATYLVSSSLANHGFTMGGFICYLFGGVKGLGLSAIFIIYFMPYIFTVIFPFSMMKGRGSGTRRSPAMLREFFISLRNMPLYAVLAAFILQILGVPRPGLAFPLDAILMVSIGLYYFTLGLNFSFRDIRSPGTGHLVLALEKFLALPLVTLAVLSLVQLDHDIESVIFLESFMPAAVYSVLSAVLHDLDSGLARVSSSSTRCFASFWSCLFFSSFTAFFSEAGLV